MDFTSQILLDVTLVKIAGRVDHVTAKELKNSFMPYLDQCAEGNVKNLIIDLSGVNYMTSAGLRVLMIAAKTCGKHKVEIAVAGLQPGIQEIFKISRFDLVLSVFPSVKSAIEHLSPAAMEVYNA